MTGSMRLEVVDQVAHLTIDRPDKRNAMSMSMWQSLADHVATVAGADDVRAVVLRGVGGSFSAGGDLTELRTSAEHADRYRALAEETVLSLMALPTPKIAHIDGACFGAGCSLALACDVRIATPSSVFGIPALKNGLTYEPVFVRRLVDVVGTGPAGLLLYGAERWDTQEALAHGLVDRSTSDVESSVDVILTTLRASDGAAVASTARSIRSAAHSH